MKCSVDKRGVYFKLTSEGEIYRKKYFEVLEQLIIKYYSVHLSREEHLQIKENLLKIQIKE